MTPGTLLAAIVAALDDAGIPHMLAGSVASSFHSQPRSTQDIDLVIDPDESSMRRLLDLLVTTDLYVGDGVAALRHRRQFTVIDSTTGWKADLIIRQDRPFSREELARRQPAEIFGCSVFVATVEDTILTRLEWAAIGESDRQLRDVVIMLQAAEATLDDGYLDQWAPELGVAPLLANARADSEG